MMGDYIFRAKITFSDATVTVTANTIEEARQMVEDGNWDSDDVSGASTSDWEITDRGKLNE